MHGSPLASHEVRWFFEGKAEDHVDLKHWFESADFVQRDPGVGPPEWKGRLDDQPDVYLLVDSADDVGIKWREGELQIKGRTARLGIQLFCGRHHGQVERWVKWSYAKLPPVYREMFSSSIPTVKVQKTRALRKLRLDTMTGAATEVMSKSFIDRGLGCELTNLEVSGNAFCSLAFEAFPDDAGMHEAFSRTVSACLEGLPQQLPLVQSHSYPSWLQQWRT